MEVQLNDIESNINILADEITDVPMSFVFNPDEMGAQEWADACKKRVIVLSGYRLNSAPYAVERGGKRVSLTCYMSPLGLIGKHQFAVPRTQGDIIIFKYLPLQIIHTKSGICHHRSLEICFNTIFLPALLELRDRYEYYGKVVLIVDGYGNRYIVLLYQNNLQIILYMI